MTSNRKKEAVNEAVALYKTLSSTSLPLSMAKIAALPQFRKNHVSVNDISRMLRDPTRKVKTRRGAPRKLTGKEQEELRVELRTKDGISVFDCMGNSRRSNRSRGKNKKTRR